MNQEQVASSILNLLTTDLVRASFGGAQRHTKIPLERAALRPVEVAGGRRLQLSRFDGRKVLYSNHTAEELPAALADILAAGFANVHISTTTEEIDLRLTKKGDLLIGRKPKKGRAPSAPPSSPHATQPSEVACAPVAPIPHNRTKEVPLPEGQADALLEAMGILDRNHRVRPTMRDKFTQINEFLKLLDHALPEVTEHRRDADAPLVVLDCGCGSSHLTLATAHFLNEIKHIPARVVGIDANAEVIEKSRQRAKALTCPIEFREARIGAVSDVQADIVLALHACDTATDDALAQAVRSQARLIMAVPCCHKNLNTTLHITGLTSVHRHGILHQRLADIVTDTFRALLLDVMGYRAEVIEFITPEHTARNLMIRAVRIGQPGKTGAVERYRQFKAFAGVTPYLETTLVKAGLMGAELA